MCSFVVSHIEGILFALTIIILVMLIVTSRKQNRAFLRVSFSVVLVLGVLAHYYVICQIPSTMDGNGVDDVNWFSALMLSFISSVEMFLGSSKIFDNGFQDFLFSSDGSIALICISFLNVIAIALSASIVFRFVFVRLSSKWNLSLRRISLNRDSVVHIFFGYNSQTRSLTKELASMGDKDKPKRSKEIIIIIDYPDDNDRNFETGLFGRLWEHLAISHANDPVARLKANMELSSIESVEHSFGDALGLKGLDEWMFRENTRLYFLSDDECANMDCLKLIKRRIDYLKTTGLIAKKKLGRVFCHAKSDGDNYEKQREYRDDFYLTFVDSSFLSIQQIIREDFMSLPINYVDIAAERIATHEPSNMTEIASLGYICSEFNAAILGFGELGQHAFGFLYEYSAFVDSQKKRSPFHIIAYDKNMNALESTFKDRYPGLDGDFQQNLVQLNEADLEDAHFFSNNADQLYPKINYYVICTGSDSRNVNIAKRLIKGLETSKHPKHLRIMVKHSFPDTIRRSVLDATHNTELRRSIAFFGDVSKIWRLDVITDNSLENEAKEFSAKYEVAASALNPPKKTIEQARQVWTNREKKLADPQQTGRNALIRMLSQDLANTKHQSTKLAILGKYDRSPEQAKLLRTSITDEYNGDTAVAPFSEKHCNYELDSREANLLLYLAIGEKLRWNASHIMLGYKYDEVKDDEVKTHNCIKEYMSLGNGIIRHYDWLVIKTTLELYCSRLTDNPGYSSMFSLLDKTNFVVKKENDES